MKKEKIVSHSKYVVKDESYDQKMNKKMNKSDKKPMDIGDALMKAKKAVAKKPKVKPSTKKNP